MIDSLKVELERHWLTLQEETRKVNIETLRERLRLGIPKWSAMYAMHRIRPAIILNVLQILELEGEQQDQAPKMETTRVMEIVPKKVCKLGAFIG